MVVIHLVREAREEESTYLLHRLSDIPDRFAIEASPESEIFPVVTQMLLHRKGPGR